MAGKKGMKHYPTELKLKVVWLYYEEGKTGQKLPGRSIQNL